MLIKQVFRDVEHRDLIADFKSELSGNIEKLVVGLYMDPGEYDARLIKEAVDGIGFNTELLCEVLFTRTNQQLKEMQDAWNHSLKEKKDMSARIADETKKLLGANHFEHLCLKVLECKRPASGAVNKQNVENDAEELNRMLMYEKEKEAKTKFVEIFSERSWSHISAIANIFDKISKKYTLQNAITHRFGDGSDTAHALCLITNFCQQPYDVWAKKMVASMKGMGTNDELLSRIVITRCEVDMANVRDTFGLRYGDGKTLKNWFENDLSGTYRALISKLCGY
jgi:hypothetical protein